ncbi:hypothetical protein [Sphingobacterium paramultivorum]|uniref:hypothetical protein n=1 Tax=Sphingobacterium paramultivorum TaxID=2886510 RepID=UPI00129C4A36|nr:hypothetical protein [Sphingobacterium paramultivorum]
MLKLLNYLSILLAGLCILGSCTIFKHRTEENQYTSAKHHKEKEVNFSYRKNDSLSRLWYFWTDSAFRFHPDSGIMGRSGGMIVRESMKSDVQGSQSIHVAYRDDLQSSSERKSKTTRVAPFGVVIVIGFVLILLMVLFICRRKIRTF